MDQLARGLPSVAARVRLAATEAGILPNDPLGPVLEAVAAIPDEVERRIAPTEARLAQLVERVERATSQPPMTNEDLRRLTHRAVQQMEGQMSQRWTQFNKFGIAIGVVVALALGGMAFGAGWLGHARLEQKPITDVTSCVATPQAGGGRAYTCTFWAEMPTKGAPR